MYFSSYISFISPISPGSPDHERSHPRCNAGLPTALRRRRRDMADHRAIAAGIGAGAAIQHTRRRAARRMARAARVSGAAAGGGAALHWHGLPASRDRPVRLPVALARRAAWRARLAVYAQRDDCGTDDSWSAPGGRRNPSVGAGRRPGVADPGAVAGRYRGAGAGVCAAGDYVPDEPDGAGAATKNRVSAEEGRN